MWLGLFKYLNYNILLKLLTIFLGVEELYIATQNIYQFKQRLIQSKILIKYNLFMELIDSAKKKKASELYFILKAKNIFIVSILSKNYPKNLLNLFSPPLVIFINCNNSSLLKKKICIENLDELSEYGKSFMEYIKDYLKNNCALVVDSGIKYENNMAQVVINCIDVNNLENLKDIGDKADTNICQVIILYNLENMHGHDTYISAENIVKNEIISAISDILIVIETDLDIKNVKLLDMFLELGKDVYAIPGNIFNKKSCLSNFAIKQGAMVITKKEDILL